jgi:hypothetical protein
MPPPQRPLIPARQRLADPPQGHIGEVPEEPPKQPKDPEDPGENSGGNDDPDPKPDPNAADPIPNPDPNAEVDSEAQVGRLLAVKSCSPSPVPKLRLRNLLRNPFVPLASLACYIYPPSSSRT